MPRSYKNQDEFFSKMKKKPALQGILDNLDSYNEDQLRDIPGQPLWVREQLIKLKQRNGLTGDQVAVSIATQMIANAIQPPAPTVKEVREWIAPSEFIGGHGGGFQLEVETGDLLMLLPPQPTRFEAWVGHTVVGFNALGWQRMLTQTTFVGAMHQTSYSNLVKTRLDTKHS